MDRRIPPLIQFKFCLSQTLLLKGQKGRRAVWAKSGHSSQYYYDMLLARSGMGEGEKANTSVGSRA